MNKSTLLTTSLTLLLFSAGAQPFENLRDPQYAVKPALVDFNAYDKLIHEVSEPRKTRLLNLDEFLKASKKENVVILDTRSDSMYNAKHVKGAIHLNFADFTQNNLHKLIPDPDTKILIYCNNNFDEGYSMLQLFDPGFISPAYFVTKGVRPEYDFSSVIFQAAKPVLQAKNLQPAKPVKKKKTKPQPVVAEPVKETPQPAVVKAIEKPKARPLTLALNIPTYINLYGYGYKNVYELSELVSVNDPRIQFEGTAVPVVVNEAQKTGALFTAPPESEAMRNAPRNADGTPAAHVDFGAYDSLTHIVQPHRESHLLHLDDFLQTAKEENVLIIDTRSDAMYKAKHVKGAVHLNFSDFTVPNLAKIIPSKNTKILIYCNNNFENDRNHFASKAYYPPTMLDGTYSRDKVLTLALNIPTYINLYGYGYTNVYELADLVNVKNPKIQFEGTSVTESTNKGK